MREISNTEKINKFFNSSPFSVFATSTMQALPSLYDTFSNTKQNIDRQYYQGNDDMSMPEYSNPYETNPWDRVDDAKKEGNAKTLSSTISGAKIGSKFSPLGTAIGAGLGFTAGLIGKGVRKRKAEDAAKEVDKLKSSYVSGYNTNAQNASEMMAQKERIASIKNSFPTSIYGM
jgi:hypothetical protein